MPKLQLALVIAAFVLVGWLSFASSTPQPSQGDASAALLSQQEKDMMVDSIKRQPEVMDAAVVQKGITLSLALVVRTGTSQQRARQLGEDFVRQVKAFSTDALPGKTVGKGKYDYLITVVLPGNKELASGTKFSFKETMSW